MNSSGIKLLIKLEVQVFTPSGSTVINTPFRLYT